MVNKLDNIFVWHFGDYPLQPIKMTSGDTLKIELEWNFTNESHSKDWSVTAFGDGRPGTLHLKHDNGLTSDFWGHITKKDPKDAKHKPPVITEAHPRIPAAPQKKK